jgi:putative spermidine/putrescine transport system substrate-binding protein
MSRRSLLALLAAAGGGALTGCAPGSNGDSKGSSKANLTVSGFGGTTQKIYGESVYTPFERTNGGRITTVTLQSDDGLARLIAQAGKPEIDMFQFSGGQEGTAKEKGLIERLDEVSASVPDELKDPDGLWTAVAVIPEGIVYNTEKIPEPPRSYLDFLKPEYAGHIAFPTITNGYGLDFLIMMAYANGGSETNIEPGFAAVKKIAKKARIFKAAAEMQTLFSQDDIWIMPYDASNAFRAKQAGLPVAFARPQEGSPANLITHVIAKGSPNADIAREVVTAALKPDAQTLLAEKLRWLPVNSETKLIGDLAKEVPVGSEALSQLKLLDRAAIANSRRQWTERFNREIAQS